MVQLHITEASKNLIKDSKHIWKEFSQGGIGHQKRSCPFFNFLCV